MKTFSSLAVKVLQDLITETMVQVGQCNASHEAVLALHRRGFVSGEVIPSLKDYDKHKYIIQNIVVAENTIQRVFACEEYGSIDAMRNSFAVIGGNLENTSVLQIAKVLLMFTV